MMGKNTRTMVNPGVDRGVVVSWLLVLGVITILMMALLAPRSASAAGPTQEFPVSEASPNQLAPAIGGGLVVWEDGRDGLSSIYGKRLPYGVEFLISSGANVKKEPMTGGGFVVWEDHRGGNADIYGYDLSAQTEFPIATGAGEQRDPAISGNRVVWEDNRSGSWEIYRYDLGTKQEFRVTTGAGDKRSPDISGNTIVWRGEPSAGVSNIYAKNIETGKEFAVSTGEAYKDMPAISGGIVVWRQESVANYDIFGRDLYAKVLQTGEVFQITTDPGDQVAPAISGNVVVWEDHRGGDADVYGKDLSTGEVFEIASGSTPQETPDISGETVVWESQRTGETNYGSYDVHGASLDTAPAVPRRLDASGSPDGVKLKWRANAEDDLAGYNVYRGGSPKGPYNRLNEQLLPGDTLSYEDADAPKGKASYYRLTAVDAAGNESGQARVKSAAHARTGITLKAGSSVLGYGKSTLLSGRLTSGGRALPGKQVIVQQKPAGARRYRVVTNGRITTRDGGRFSKKVRPLKNTYYRVRFAGEPAVGLRPSTSPREWVRVKPKVSLAEPRRSRGFRLNLNGKVAEVKRGAVKVTINRNGKVIARKNVRLNDSRYRLVYRAPGAGRYAVRVNFARSFAHLGDRSPIKKFRIFR